MSICVYVDGQIHAPAEATVPVLDLYQQLVSEAP
jgi:hypothetical protein